ncbi:MAG: YgfZ/GcvT domain-containing protein [Chroococcales cyanobacterium]
MNESLKNLQLQAGAIFEADVPVSFGNETEAMKAAKSGVAICDRSSWGLIKVTDSDRLQFLHNQSTNNLNALKPNQGCDTVFVNSTGRTIDLATVYITEDSVLLLISPNRRQTILQWLDKYLFPMDRVKLTDITNQYSIFSLIGQDSDRLLNQLNADTIIGQEKHSHSVLDLNGMNVRVAMGNGLELPGYTLITPAENAATLWSQLTNLGAIPMGDRSWETLRIQQGRPAADQELTEDYNPLEAGLWKAISFNKGCYIGQETIARLNTYKGVKQRLWGLKLNAPVETGIPITVNDEKVGLLTSYTQVDDDYIGLGYVRTKAGGEGLTVKVGEAEGELIPVPFLTHEYYEAEKDK